MSTRIPRITDAQLKRLAARIKPVRKDQSGALRYCKKCDLRKEEFNFYGELCESAGRLVEIAQIETWHTCGSTMGVYSFMPTIAEVLAQIPEVHLPRTVAFKTTGPEDDWVPQLREKGRPYHRGTTILYARP